MYDSLDLTNILALITDMLRYKRNTILGHSHSLFIFDDPEDVFEKHGVLEAKQ